MYGIITVNYIDDFICIVPVHDALRAFQLVNFVINEVGLVTSHEKTVYPSHITTCLGIIINSKNFTLSIPKDKLKVIVQMCKRYILYKKINKHQIQSLLGNLIFIHKAITPRAYS
jgi:hypothetical protein